MTSTERNPRPAGRQVGQNGNSFVTPAKAGIHACRMQVFLMVIPGLCGNVLYQPLDSSFRWNDEHAA